MGHLLLELGGPLPVVRLLDLAVVEGLGPAGVAGLGPVVDRQPVGRHSEGSVGLAPELGPVRLLGLPPELWVERVERPEPVL